MYRPIIKKYNDLYDIESYSASISKQNEMKQAPIGVISQGVVFFYNIVNELLRDFQLYSKSQLKEVQEITQQEDNLPLNMVGSTLSIFLQKVISEISNK